MSWLPCRFAVSGETPANCLRFRPSTSQNPSFCFAELWFPLTSVSEDDSKSPVGLPATSGRFTARVFTEDGRPLAHASTEAVPSPSSWMVVDLPGDFTVANEKSVTVCLHEGDLEQDGNVHLLRMRSHNLRTKDKRPFYVLGSQTKSDLKDLLVTSHYAAHRSRRSAEGQSLSNGGGTNPGIQMNDGLQINITAPENSTDSTDQRKERRCRLKMLQNYTFAELGFTTVIEPR